MAESKTDPKVALDTIRGLMNVAAGTHGLTAADRVRLVSALLTIELVDARLAGLNPANIDELMRQGEALSVAIFGTNDEAASSSSPGPSAPTAPRPAAKATPAPQAAKPAAAPPLPAGPKQAPATKPKAAPAAKPAAAASPAAQPPAAAASPAAQSPAAPSAASPPKPAAPSPAAAASSPRANAADALPRKPASGSTEGQAINALARERTVEAAGGLVALPGATPPPPEPAAVIGSVVGSTPAEDLPLQAMSPLPEAAAANRFTPSMVSIDDLFGDAFGGGDAADGQASTALPGDLLIGSITESEPMFDITALVEPEDLAPPEPLSPDTFEASHAAIRKHPRYAVQARAQVQLAGHPGSIEMGVRDVSLGGLFLETEQALPTGGHLQMAIAVGTDPIVVTGRVVHVHASPGGAATTGCGVQFDQLSPKSLSQLANLIESSATSSAPEAAVDVSGPVATSRRLIAGIDEGELYRALELEPTTPQPLVEGALRRIRSELEGVAGTKDAQAAQKVESGLRVLARIERILGDASRRAAYDFARDVIDVERRIEEADNGTGLELAALRRVWSQVFPERTESARAQVASACELAEQHRYGQAAEVGGHALTDDPFNTLLRDQLRRWTTLEQLAAYAKEKSAPDAGWSQWAESSGLQIGELRAHWSRLLPDALQEAAKLARKALQAETIKRFDVAAQAAEEALALDPFNVQLSEAAGRWRSAASPEG